MRSKLAVNFETYYFFELLEKIRQMGQQEYDQESQEYLERLLRYLEDEDHALESIEKLAAAQSTSDLAIFFSDILEQLQASGPDSAMENMPERAGDFLEIFQVYLQNEEWREAIDRDLYREKPPETAEETADAAEADQGEAPFETLFEVADEELPDEEEAPASDTDELDTIVDQVTKRESRPISSESEEDRERKRMLRDYVVNEAQSYSTEALQTIEQLADSPGDETAAHNLKECFKGLKDLGQIHAYPGVEQAADQLLQIFNQLQQSESSFGEADKQLLESLFHLFPAHVDAVVENRDDLHLEEIQQKLSDLRSQLFETEPVAAVDAPQTLEGAFQDLVTRYARKIVDYLESADGDPENLSEIFENLRYWNDLLLPAEARETIEQVRELLQPENLAELSSEDRQLFSDMVRSWESTYVELTPSLWKDYSARLGQLGKKPADMSADSALQAFQEVTNRQLDYLQQNLRPESQDLREFLTQQFPGFLAQLKSNSSYVNARELESLANLLESELEQLDLDQPVDERVLCQNLKDFLTVLQHNIAGLPEPIDSNALRDRFQASLEAPEAPPAEEPAEEEVESLADSPEAAATIEFAEEEEEAQEIASEDEILEVFRMEAINYVTELQDHLGKLNSNPEDKTVWRKLGVTAHTLKGSSRMVGRNDIAELAEPIDKVVDLIEHESLPVQPELLNILGQLVTALEGQAKDQPGNAQKALAELHDYLNRVAPQQAEEIPREAPEAVKFDDDTSYIYLKEQDPELLEIFQNEVASNFDIVEKNLTNLQKFTYDKEALQQVERAVHEIRAAAKMLGISEIATVADKLENICEQLISRSNADLETAIPVVRRAMVVIRELTVNHQVRQNLYSEALENLTRVERGEEPLPAASFVETPAEEWSGEAAEIAAPSEEEQDDLTEAETAGETAEEIPLETETPREEEAESAEVPPDEEGKEVAPQVLELYLQEAKEQLDDINYLLLKLEKDSDNEELQHHLMRCMHTLKGSSGMVYATHIEALAHRCEDILEKHLKEKRTLAPELFDLLFEVLDEINHIMEAIRVQGREKPQKHAKLLEQLENYYRGLGLAAPVAQPQPESEPVAQEEKPGEGEAAEEAVRMVSAEELEKAEGGRKETFLRLNINKMNHLLNVAAELVIGNNQFKNQLDGLKNFIPQMNSNLKVFRDTEDYISTILRESRHIQEIVDPLIETKPGTKESLKKQLDSLQRVLKNVKTLQDEITSITHSLRENSKTYDENLQKLNKLSNDLLDEIMQARLVPINMLFQRFHRPIRDLARQLKKQIRLSLQGEETELDRTLIDELYEPLLHIVRNAIDHGLEPPEERKAAGKDPEGLIEIKAYRDRNQVIIEISDDGRGINLEQVKQSAVKKGLLTQEDAQTMTEQELFEYLFYPGFSTAKETTLVSGRGVGLDAVKAQIEKAKGDIRMYTDVNKGTTFSIRVPISLSVIQSMLVDVNGHVYSVPLLQVEETLHVSGQDLLNEDNRYYIRYREKKIPVMQLSRLLKLRDDQNQPISPAMSYPVIIVQDEGNRVALLVDKIIRREEILIKSLGPGLRRLKYISGGSIMADGQVVLVLDVAQIILDNFKGGQASAAVASDEAGVVVTGASPGPPRAGRRKQKRIEGRKPMALIVDDSLSIRKYLSSLLMQRGYITDTARNGYEALELLNKQEFDIMVTDLEMPKLSGYELIETLRYDQRFSGFPIIVLTGRAGDNFRQLTTELGADAYIIKPFKDRELFDQIEKFIDYQS